MVRRIASLVGSPPLRMFAERRLARCCDLLRHLHLQVAFEAPTSQPGVLRRQLVQPASIVGLRGAKPIAPCAGLLADHHFLSEVMAKNTTPAGRRVRSGAPTGSLPTRRPANPCLLQQHERLFPKQPGDVDEFGHIKPTLAAFEFGTKDCGRRSLSASCCWVMPDRFLAATRSARACRYSS